MSFFSVIGFLLFFSKIELFFSKKSGFLEIEFFLSKKSTEWL